MKPDEVPAARAITGVCALDTNLDHRGFLDEPRRQTLQFTGATRAHDILIAVAPTIGWRDMSAASTGDALICAVIADANRAALAQEHCNTAPAIDITLSHCH